MFNPSTRRYGPAWSCIETVSPPTVNDSLTATFVLLMDSESVPPSVTPGMFTFTVPLNFPAIPAAVRMNAPWPLVSDTKFVVPSPRPSTTLLAATRVTLRPSVLVTCSKEKLPLSVWPRMFRLMSVPSTRT